MGPSCCQRAESVSKQKLISIMLTPLYQFQDFLREIFPYFYCYNLYMVAFTFILVYISLSVDKPILSSAEHHNHHTEQFDVPQFPSALCVQSGRNEGFFSRRQTCRNGISKSYGKRLFNFARDWKTIAPSGCTTFYSHPWRMNLLLASLPALGMVTLVLEPF